MKIPNLASRNHSGTACFLSESQVGSKLEDCRELDSCPNPGTPAETSVAAIRELNLLRFMAILLIFQRELVIGQVRSQHARTPTIAFYCIGVTACAGSVIGRSASPCYQGEIESSRELHRC